jgi:hypothetical protein
VAGETQYTLEQATLEMTIENMRDFLEGNAADPSIVTDLDAIADQMRNIGYLGGDEEEEE